LKQSMVEVANLQTAYPSTIRMALWGASLTAGVGLEKQEHALPARLEVALRSRGHDVDVVNLGIPGETLTDALARLDFVLATTKFDIVVVSLGGNDIHDYDNNNTAFVDRILREIIRKLQNANITVWLAGVRVRHDWSWKYRWRLLTKTAVNSILTLFRCRLIFHANTIQYTWKFSALYPRIAADLQLPLYPYIQAGVKKDMWGDMIHPNSRGVDAIVERMLPFVLCNLQAFNARRSSLRT
jgi:acyl-CoA thioesterase-1